MSAMSAWIKGVQALLAPCVPQCLICGKKRRSSPRLPGICVSCAAAIPWIRTPRCPKCGRHVGCPDCTRSGEPSPIICNRSAVAYTSGMRDILGQYKYRGNERYASLLGLMLDRAYLILRAEREKKERNDRLSHRPPAIPTLRHKRPVSRTFWKADLLVPVPVSDSRLAERGFNQAEQLADVLSRRRAIPQLPLLIRTHHTGKQSFKSRAERLADMKHAFTANPELRGQFSEWLKSLEPLNRPLRIIIVDDIYTTGSTIRACAEAVRQRTEACGHHAEIYSLTWARS
jgi:competence protein ComFC